MAPMHHHGLPETRPEKDKNKTIAVMITLLAIPAASHCRLEVVC